MNSLFFLTTTINLFLRKMTNSFLLASFKNIYFIFSFSATVHIQYQPAPISDAQQSGQNIIHSTEWSPHCPKHPLGPIPCSLDIID